MSNNGEVRSLDRYILHKDGKKQFRRGKIITKIENTDGYYQLKLCKDGKCYTDAVHRIVANAFIPKPSDNNFVRYEVNHKDCNRKNNNVDNLEWISHGDNVRYAIHNNNHVCTRDLTGKNNPNFGNKILSKRYQKNPLLSKEKNSRPGVQNGRCVRVNLYNSDMKFIKAFNYMGECAMFLREQGYSKASIDSIRCNINEAIKKDKTYLGLRYKKCA